MTKLSSVEELEEIRPTQADRADGKRRRRSSAKRYVPRDQS